MDLLSSVFSVVRDFSDKDRQFKNLNFQITYTVQKANHLLKKVQEKSSGVDFMIRNLQRRIGQAVEIQQKLLALLNTQNIGMRDKIRLSLPFDQTKNTATTALENLQKAINDLKDFVEQQPKQQEVGGVKRKVSQCSIHAVNSRPMQKLTVQEVDQQIQQIYEMGPTVQQNEICFSQMKNKKQILADINITIMGEKQIIEILEKQQPDLLNTKKRIKLEQNVAIQQKVFTVARLNFKKVYNKIKKVTKDIDRISKDAHFHIICRKEQQVISKEKVQQEQINSQHSTKKHKSQVNQEQEQDVFFSFPQQNVSNIMNNSKIIMKKQDEKKTVYRFQGAQWQKVEDSIIQVLNGDKLAAFINPQSKQPSLYFKVSYGFQ